MSTTGVSAAHGAVTRERYRVNYQTQERSEQEEGMRMHFSEMYLFVQVETNLRLFFFNKFMPTGILMRFCIRPFPLKAFHPLQSFIHSSVYPSISLGERCFHLVAMYVRHCGIKSVFFFTFPLGLLTGLMLLLPLWCVIFAVVYVDLWVQVGMVTVNQESSHLTAKAGLLSPPLSPDQNS